MRSRGLAALVLAAWFLAACSAAGETIDTVATEPADAVAEEEENQIVTEPPATTPPSSAGSSGIDAAFPPELAGLVGVAVDDLVKRLTADPTAITVVTVEEVVWPDGALGCPQPGRAYTQVPVDGLRILLEHDGAEFAYHSGGTTGPFLCGPLELTDPGDPTDRQGTVPTEHPGGPSGEPDV
jgi:hypothetical protein